MTAHGDRTAAVEDARHSLRRLRDGISPHPLADAENVTLCINDLLTALAEAEAERDQNSAACVPLANALRTILNSPFSDGTWDGLIEDALYEMAAALLPPTAASTDGA